ncbi:hypothetical protein [Pedobacter sp. P26]|uniref:hypothetical protein n=1 Tax=Pedobacter sp. P26 TaxID=3423956 RepID=UPI003D66E046
MKKLLIIVLFTAIGLNAMAQDYVITKFGVGTDSTKLNTKAIQSVIDQAYQKGGGTIVIPKGVYLSGALFLSLKRNCCYKKVRY